MTLALAAVADQILLELANELKALGRAVSEVSLVAGLVAVVAHRRLFRRTRGLLGRARLGVSRGREIRRKTERLGRSVVGHHLNKSMNPFEVF